MVSRCEAVNRGAECRCDGIRVKKEGRHFLKGIFSKCMVMVAWNGTRTYIGNFSSSCRGLGSKIQDLIVYLFFISYFAKQITDIIKSDEEMILWIIFCRWIQFSLWYTGGCLLSSCEEGFVLPVVIAWRGFFNKIEAFFSDVMIAVTDENRPLYC